MVKDCHDSRPGDVQDSPGTSCHLSRPIQLSGTIRLTPSHIQFDSDEMKPASQIKSGFLRTRTVTRWTNRWSTKWFVLEDTKLSWYNSRTEPYFPLGIVDLRDVVLTEDHKGGVVLRTSTNIIELLDESGSGLHQWIEDIQGAMIPSVGDRVQVAIPYSSIVNVGLSACIDADVIEVSVNEHTQVETYLFTRFTDLLATLHQIRDAIGRNNTGTSVPDKPLKAPTGLRNFVFGWGLLRMAMVPFEAFLSIVRILSLSWLGPHRDTQTGRRLGQAKAGGHNGITDDQPLLVHDYQKLATDFSATFAHEETDVLLGSFSGYLYNFLPVYGTLFISSAYFCFKPNGSLPAGTLIELPLREILSVEKTAPTCLGYLGFIINIKGHEELFFQFATDSIRDAVFNLLGYQTDRHEMSTDDSRISISNSGSESNILLDSQSFNSHGKTPSMMDELPVSDMIKITPPLRTTLSVRPEKPLHFTFLTIGSRGDVQPYIALAKGLMADGHRCRIATHEEFKDWIESHGLEFGFVAGDPGAIMKMCTENGLFTMSFLKKSFQEDWWGEFIDNVLHTAWDACQGTDVLVACSHTVAGYHIAEALGIPLFLTHSLPWSPTRAYPNGFLAPARKMGGTYNYMTYVLLGKISWKRNSKRINQWRQNVLHLPPTSPQEMNLHKIPFLYSFSPSVVQPALEWPEWINVTGYWTLDNAEVNTEEWVPPNTLVEFIRNARALGKKVVYVGFGSITVRNPGAVMQCIFEAVVESGVYAIVAKGWSDRLCVETRESKESYPPQVYVVSSVPHDWLFSHLDAACHHGGAGTTGASMKTGIPTIIHPFFGDQFFWATRVQALGVGIVVHMLIVPTLVEALTQATSDRRLISKAKSLGKRIREEDGVSTAITTIYQNMEYSRSLFNRQPFHHKNV